jgi:superfamily II DNA or RNA helicase
MGRNSMILIKQVSGNVVRISIDSEKEKIALDKLLVRKTKDAASGLKTDITVEFDNGHVPAGLVPYIVENLGGKFQVELDLFEEDDTHIPVDASCFVGKEPREYQITAARKLLSSPRGIFRGVTGAGKTATIGGMVHAIRRVRPEWNILIIGFTVDHWTQLQKSLEEMRVETQVVGKGNPNKKVFVGRFDAFGRAILKEGEWNRIIRTAEVVIFDEIRHLGTAGTYIHFARAINPLRSYGFDATPFSNYASDDPYTCWEDMNVVGYCGPVRYRIGYKDLQRQGFIPLTYVHFIHMPKPPHKLPRDIFITTDYTRIYKNLVVENDFRTSRFARLVANLAGAGKVIVLIKQHEHARRIMQMLANFGVESMSWFGAKKALVSTLDGVVRDAPFDTSWVRKAFMEGDLRVVVGSNVLSEAISLDAATDVVNMAAGNTFSLTGQRAGRAMRRDDGRTPIVHYWDAYDSSQFILENQSKKRKKHYEAEGLDIVDVPCPEVIADLRVLGIRSGGVSW